MQGYGSVSLAGFWLGKIIKCHEKTPHWVKFSRKSFSNMRASNVNSPNGSATRTL